ncbi:MAG TPA: rRNA maturation RNase YbeY [Candidatus Limnocylindria bacterium]|nr:rRNA maturation RNase YbeY [Candidatus Limnocylindria bacterium]
MILIKNTQRKIKVDTITLKKDAQRILDLLGYVDFDLGILLTTNKTIHEYNLHYRGKDKPTDILSFPTHPDLKPGQRIVATDDDEKSLGDVIIAPEYVVAEAEKLKVTFEQRMQRLLVHGICHLLGYDHIEDADYKIMLQKEMYLLRMLKK